MQGHVTFWYPRTCSCHILPAPRTGSYTWHPLPHPRMHLTVPTVWIDIQRRPAEQDYSNTEFEVELERSPAGPCPSLLQLGVRGGFICSGSWPHLPLFSFSDFLNALSTLWHLWHTVLRVTRLPCLSGFLAGASYAGNYTVIFVFRSSQVPLTKYKLDKNVLNKK